MILLCAGSLWLQFRHIERTLPYPIHIDEQHVAVPARHMLVDNTDRWALDRRRRRIAGVLLAMSVATASYALANPWQPSWLLELFRRWGIVAY